jgi:dethiobiotin synthetase
MPGVFITGTSTDVGKTHIGVLLCRQLRESGVTVVPRKPIETGCEPVNGELIPKDATALKQAAGYAGSLNEVCPFRFEPAISPVRAALLAHRELNIEQLVSSCLAAGEKDFLLVEGAGGFYSPLTENGLNADLASALQLPVLLVANDTLGVINQVLLSAEAIKNRGLSLVGVVLNTVDDDKPAHMDNAADLRQLLDYPVFSQSYSALDKAVLAKDLLDRVLAQNNLHKPASVRKALKS